MPKYAQRNVRVQPRLQPKGVPILIKTIPRIAPTAREIQPKRARRTLGDQAEKVKEEKNR